MATNTSTKLVQEQRLQQRLVPQQVRFVKMLEMSGPEIEDEVNREIDDNPALEKVDDTPVQTQDSKDDIPYYRLYASNRSADDPEYESITADSSDSLQEHLLRQLSEHSLDDKESLIARYIIGNIDNNGYLTRDTFLIANDISFQEDMDVTTAEVNRILDIIHTLDPAGIGAIDLRECLLLQLQQLHQNHSQALATEIIANYFDLFSKKHFDQLCSELAIGRDELSEAMEEIKSLNPRPGNAFEPGASTQPIHTIIPDFAVEVEGNNASVMLLNTVPELRIEESFDIDAPRSVRNNDEFMFIKQKRDDASSFIKMLQMRQETLMKVMKAIVSLQKDFFTNQDDESLIRPMILRDVAAMTGLDLSVISRATMGKWVSTPHGVYPLKMFFNERVRDDDDTSSHEISAALCQLIDSEDKKRPLSDDILTTMLNEKGYRLARRTVAKYRERMNIPVARLRREI